MNIFSTLREDIVRTVLTLSNDPIKTDHIVVEVPKDTINGDLATNAAMVIAKELQRSPRDIAMDLKTKLLELDYVAHIEVAGPGFINFTLHAFAWHKSLEEIIKAGAEYGKCNIGHGSHINIEYSSPNPTGPMHIGHARGTVYGDVLARLMKFCGYNVVKECYINDAGAQIDTLAQSAFLRYKEAARGEKAEIPPGLYPGEYLKPVGEKLAIKYGKSLLDMPINESAPIIKAFTIEEMLKIIKDDLLMIGVEHEVFTSEAGLYKAGNAEKAMEILSKLGLIYNGILPPPKGQLPDDWEETELTLFKSTNYGDDQDRPVLKSDGSYAYIMGDIAYSYDKIQRGADCIVIILGADHAGYVKRIKAVVSALGGDKVSSNIVLCQLVNYLENGDPIKMSKRAGTFTTVRDVVNELGKDIVRFMMLTRKNDTVLDFDLVIAKEQSKENPVFYVQYAYVRTKSIMHNIQSQMPESYRIFQDMKYDLSKLSTEVELNLIKLLTSWPRIVELSAMHFEPHRIAFYLQSVAAEFHALWNMGKENSQYRFVIECDVELTASRCALVQAVHNVMKSGFDIIGIAALEKM